MATASRDGVLVLGAGMSGLGAALSLGVPAFEARSRPGGICYSYYVDESGASHDPTSQDVSSCFRFEPAGGHFLFSPKASTLQLLGRYARFRRYERKAVVFLPKEDWLVPFPIQEHLGHLPTTLRKRIRDEILAREPAQEAEIRTFRDWLLRHFAPTLCELFFFPFNDRYTAGLLEKIAPQDAYKSPINRARILAGFSRQSEGAGYNSTFYYPENGLDGFVRSLAAGASINFNHRVEKISPATRSVHFSNGKVIGYRRLISSLSLHQMTCFCGLETVAKPDPATAVLVVNVAAEVGPRCPAYHWVYVSRSSSGMHRVGFYSHVDSEFLPAGAGSGIVSLYAERSYGATERPDTEELKRSAEAMVEELQEWGFIAEPIVVRSSFTNPAYTWSWPGSRWPDEAEEALADCGVQQIGRYGHWRFQGMADSFAQGWAIRDTD